jgi:hypothetical protein
MKKFLAISILAFLIASCNQRQSDDVSFEVADSEAEMMPLTRQAMDAPPAPINPTVTNEVIKKKIIRDGRLGLRVTELEKSKTLIDTLVRANGAYYANESFQNSDWESSYNLKIRVPSLNFDKFISGIEAGEGEVLYKVIDARDVTAQFIDLETRLENKRSYLVRYNDLLKKANSVNDILAIEEKIRGLEEEIESTTGQLKYLSDQVDYSTLDLTLTKQKDFKYNPEKRAKFSERFKQSLSKGWFEFVDFVLFIIKIWPFWIIIAVMVYFWRKYRKARKKN